MRTDTHSINTAIAAPRFAIGENVALTMSSREMSELTGKRHDSVKRTIETLAFKTDKDGNPTPVIGVPQIVEYLDSLGRPAIEYLVNKRDSFVVVAQLSPEFTAALVDRWQELESQSATPITLPSYAETLRLYADQIEETQRVTAERDTAIATKALIGSKREATAMATASSAVKKASHLANELGRGALQATMIAVEKANGCTYGKQGFRPLKKWCKANGVTAAKVPCPRYGEASAWPAAAWLEVYGVDLAGLFGGVQA